MSERLPSSHQRGLDTLRLGHDATLSSWITEIFFLPEKSRLTDRDGDVSEMSNFLVAARLEIPHFLLVYEMLHV
jgi:hypothetical protein